ncbi:MAG: hypothetical protein BGO98_23200 [Myxococcales bacterium 68-20]|nr:MAG: hypothetical protein BGO98_23200 [Myxococcales bacterium 68-20]
MTLTAFVNERIQLGAKLGQLEDERAKLLAAPGESDGPANVEARNAWIRAGNALVANAELSQEQRAVIFSALRQAEARADRRGKAAPAEPTPGPADPVLSDGSARGAASPGSCAPGVADDLTAPARVAPASFEPLRGTRPSGGASNHSRGGRDPVARGLRDRALWSEGPLPRRWRTRDCDPLRTRKSAAQWSKLFRRGRRAGLRRKRSRASTGSRRRPCGGGRRSSRGVLGTSLNSSGWIECPRSLFPPLQGLRSFEGEQPRALCCFPKYFGRFGCPMAQQVRGSHHANVRSFVREQCGESITTCVSQCA